MILPRLGPILAESAWVLGVRAMAKTGKGYSTHGKVNGWPLSHKVSLVWVSLNFTTPTMSPATPWLTFAWSFPRGEKSVPIRSSVSLLALYTRVSDLMVPDQILSIRTGGSTTCRRTHGLKKLITREVQ